MTDSVIDQAEQATHPSLAGGLPFPESELDTKQGLAIEAVDGALRQASRRVSDGPGTPSAAPIILMLEGGPGCGKSAVTQLLVHKLVSRRVRVLVTATTATAARRLGLSPANTAHSAMQLPRRGPLLPMLPRTAATLALQMADIVVVDECSMLTAQLLDAIAYRLATATAEGAPPKVLLLVGDLGQLPPICEHGRNRGRRGAAARRRRPWLCPHCHLLRSATFAAAKHLELDCVHRHADDPELSAFLHELRHGRPTSQRLHEVLGDCFRPADDLPRLLDESAVVLCTHNRDVRAHNQTALAWHEQHGSLEGPIYEVAMEHDADKAPPRARANAAAWLGRKSFHLLSHVAIGCRVIYTFTQNKRTGATNSATGTITAVDLAAERPPCCPEALRDQPWVQAVHVRLDGSGKTVRVSRTRTETKHDNGHAFTKRTFPLSLGYAMTAHRCQGATLKGTTILHVRSAFAPAQVYVMLSRVTSRRRLRVLGELTPEHFTPAGDEAFAAFDDMDVDDEGSEQSGDGPDSDMDTDD